MIMVDKPDMSKCFNVEQYEEQINHWQALKIEQLEAENERLKKKLFHFYYREACDGGASSDQAKDYADDRVSEGNK